VRQRGRGFSRWGPPVELISGERGTEIKIMSICHNFGHHRVPMQILPMRSEIADIPNPVIGKPSLPDLAGFSENGAEIMRVSAFDQLNRMFDRHVLCGRKQKVNVIRHQDELVQRVALLPSVVKEGLEKNPGVCFDHK
jgi:hypothetical protein